MQGNAGSGIESHFGLFSAFEVADSFLGGEQVTEVSKARARRSFRNQQTTSRGAYVALLSRYVS